MDNNYITSLYNSLLCARVLSYALVRLQRTQVPLARQEGVQHNFWNEQGYQRRFQSRNYQVQNGAQYQYNNFDVASRLHPELPDFRQIDYQEPPTENMYSERGNCFAGNRAGCSENTPIRLYENYPPRGMSVLHKVNNRLPWRRRKKRTRIINDNPKPNNTDGNKPIDKELCERVNSTANVIDVIETTQVDIVNDHKQSLEVKSVPCTTKSSDIEMSSKQSEVTSSESGHQNVNVTETVSEVDVGENNNSNAEKQLMSTTDNSSNNCSQEVCLADEDKSCLLSNEFVDSRVLELNITSPIKENTESPKKQKLDTINFKQILSNLSGILQEDGQLKSNTDTNQTEMVDKSYAISGDDLLELLQSSISCNSNSNSLIEGLDMKSNLNDCRRMHSKSPANSSKISKIIDKPIQKDKIPKRENKANKNPYFPTLGNYSIPKLTATRKTEFSDTNELYLNRMHTLFGSDYSENESADECSSRTSKMKVVTKEKTVDPKEKLSKCSIEKHKSKRKVEWKTFKPSKRHSTELKKIDKRRHSLEITRSPKLQQSELNVPSQTKLMDKHFTGKNEDRRFPKLPESELKASDEAKLIDKHSARKNEGRRLSCKIQESEMKDLYQTNLVDKHFTGKNEDRRTPKIREYESKAPIHTKLTDKFPTGKNEDIRSPKLAELELKTSDKISTGKNEGRGSPKTQKSELNDPTQAKLVDKQFSAKNEDRKTNKIEETELKPSNQVKLVEKHSAGQNEDRGMPKMKESKLKDQKQAKLVDNHSTGKNEDRESIKLQESELKDLNHAKLEKHSARHIEDRKKPKIKDSDLKDSKQVKLVEKHPAGHIEDRRTPKLLPNQTKLADKHSTGQNEDKGSPKMKELELKDAKQAELVDKHVTGKNEDRRSIELRASELKAPNQAKLSDKHSTGQNEDKGSPKIKESQFKGPKQAKLVDKHLTGKNEDSLSINLQESELKYPSHAKLVDIHFTGQNECRGSPEITETELKDPKQAKLVDKNSAEKNEDRRSSKMQESEMKDPNHDKNIDRGSPKLLDSELKASDHVKLVDKHPTGSNDDRRSSKIPTSELKASDQAKLLEKYSTGKNQDSCRTDYKIINSQDKMVYKRSHNPDPMSNKRRRTSAEEILTDIKKTKTKIVTNNTKETIFKDINDTSDKDIKQCKSKSDNSATNEKYQTNITSDSNKAIISEEYKTTKTGDVESRSHLDNETEQISEVGSSNSSTATHTEKDFTSLLKNGIVSFEKVPFFHSSPLSPFQLPLRQTISQCSIVLNDCCDEAVTLERPDIQEIVQIIVNKSIKHITDGIIEILPNIPVVDLTDDGDSRETQLSGISEPELSCRSKGTTITIGTKQELLDILKEQSDKSLSPSEQITLYRSDETLNNSLEIQATSASISAAALSSTGMVHPEVKQGKHLKVEDDSGVDMNESEEEGNKISSTATNNVSNNSRSTCIVVSPRPATATSEDNHTIVSGSNVPNTSTAALQAIASESHSLVTNSVKFPVNTRQSCILSTNSSVLSRNLTNSSRLPGDTFLPPPNKSVLDIPSSSQNTDSATPIVELPALQAIGSMLQQAYINGSGLQDASRNSIWSRERSPPPPYPAVTPRYVHTSCNNPVGQSTTNNADCNIQPTHTSMETYKKDFNNLGALLVEYLLFFKNIRKAQSNYIYNIKKLCVTSPLLLANELCRFQDYYRDNITYLRTGLKKAVQNLNLTSLMKVNDVPNFLNAIEVCLFQESSLTSKTSVVLWLHSLLAGSEDCNFWHGSLCCLYRYLETVVEKLRCRNQSDLPYSTDQFSLQQRNLLKNQIEEYNKICAKCILMHERTVNLTIDLTGNEAHQVSGKKRKSKTKSTTFQKIRLPLTVPYDVNVSTASISTSALSTRTSVVSSKTTPTTGLTSISNGTALNSQLMQLNHSAGAANSPVYPGTINHPSRTTNITILPRTDSSPVHTSSSLNYSIQAQEKLATLLNCPVNNDMSHRNATATLNFPTHALSVIGSPAHQPVQQSNPPVYNSSAQSTPIRNSPVPISAVNNIPARLTVTPKSPSRISSTLKSPAHTPAALNSPAHITGAFNSPGHSSAALNTNCSDNPHVFKPPQAQYRFRCPSNRVQLTSVSMSPSQYSGQSSTIAQLNASGVQASPLRSLQDLVGSPSANANSTVEKESLTLRNLLESGSSYLTPSYNSADPSTANDIGEKSPVYAPMLFSPSSYQVDEVDNGDNIETIDLTWVDDVDADHLQMEIDYFIKKEEPSEENHVVLNQEQFPVTPSPTDSGIASPPVQGEINELYTNRTCICANRAEYICGCRQAMYCSLPCQKQDWASHKAICLKYNAKNKEATSSGEQQ